MAPSASLLPRAATLAVLFAFALPRCSLDERELRGLQSLAEGGRGGDERALAGAPFGMGGEPGSGGSPIGAAASGGSDGTSHGAGSSMVDGSGGEAGELTGSAGFAGHSGVGGCGDLDGNQVDDCQETLVANSRFDFDASAWQAEPTLEQQWDARNAHPDDDSGALSIVNDSVGNGTGNTMGGSRQCLPATGNTTYQLASLVFIPGGQGTGRAGIGVWFFAADDCADFSLTSASALVSEVDAWEVASGVAISPPATRSMFVRLVASKPFPEPPLNALFDDVLVRAH